MTTISSSSNISTDPRVAQAFLACREVTRSRARNFYHGLRLTPEPRRSALYAVYAWMRAADDEADASPDLDTARRLLARRRAALERLAAGGEPESADPAWLALAEVLRSFPVNPADLASMIDGLEEDMDHSGYDTRDDLRRYCERVASTVGRVCVAIWGLEPDANPAAALPLATRKGVAFQLTNILRDFREDFAQGRVYIAREDLDAAGVSPAQLARWEQPERCEELVRSVARWARREYEGSAALERMIDRPCAPALWAMTRIYSGLLAVVERDPRRVAGPSRIRLHALRKASIAAAGLARCVAGARS